MELWRANLGQRGTSFAVLVVCAITWYAPAFTSHVYAQTTTPTASASSACKTTLDSLQSNQGSLEKALTDLRTARDAYYAGTADDTAYKTTFRSVVQRFGLLKKDIEATASGSCGKSQYDTAVAKYGTLATSFNQLRGERNLRELLTETDATWKQLFPVTFAAYPTTDSDRSKAKCTELITKARTQYQTLAAGIKDADARAGDWTNPDLLNQNVGNLHTQGLSIKNTVDELKAVGCTTEVKEANELFQKASDEITAVEKKAKYTGETFLAKVSAAGKAVIDTIGKWAESCTKGEQASWWDLAGKFLEAGCALSLAFAEGITKIVERISELFTAAYDEW